MPPRLITILVLILLLVIWKLFGKRIIAALLVQSAARGGLKSVGRRALIAQPETITLGRVEFPEWQDRAAVDELKNPLLAGGFDYVGTFSVDKMPGMKLAVLVNADQHIAAHIYEHPKAGVWVELVTRYDDGSSHSLSTLPATGIQSPPWVQIIRAAKAPAGELVRQLVKERHSGDMKRVTADTAVQEFQEAYAKIMFWQKNRGGLSTEEMAQVVRNWAKKQGAGA